MPRPKGGPGAIRLEVAGPDKAKGGPKKRRSPKKKKKKKLSPKTPTLPEAVRPGVSFSPRTRVLKFATDEADLDDRRDHWHAILDAAALYNSDEDSADDTSSEEEEEEQAPAAEPAAELQPQPPAEQPPAEGPAPPGPTLRSRRRSSQEAELDTDAPRRAALRHSSPNLRQRQLTVRVCSGQRDGEKSRRIWCLRRTRAARAPDRHRCEHPLPLHCHLPCISPDPAACVLHSLGQLGKVVGRLPSKSQRLLQHYMSAAGGCASSALGLTAAS